MHEYNFLASVKWCKTNNISIVQLWCSYLSCEIKHSLYYSITSNWIKCKKARKVIKAQLFHLSTTTESDYYQCNVQVIKSVHNVHSRPRCTSRDNDTADRCDSSMIQLGPFHVQSTFSVIQISSEFDTPSPAVRSFVRSTWFKCSCGVMHFCFSLCELHTSVTAWMHWYLR